jgi:hypothetical protein
MPSRAKGSGLKPEPRHRRKENIGTAFLIYAGSIIWLDFPLLK